MISIWNNHTQTIGAVIEWFNPNCKGDPWEKAGWYVIEPGTTKQVWRGNHNFNRFWYGFVFAVDGRKWTGNFPETVPPQAFQWCRTISSSTSESVGMFEKDAAGSGSNWVWAFGEVIPIP
ncbi:hypothetical protein C9J60_24715 [Streptomyces sp. A244]|uniref:DUF1036 domain-containing protein n=1 Tax=Streptomyces sp. A244 TaxID=2137016 RepID=UPI000D1B3E74|nr:DUF1036 domain-containing protein [Streptomyces sp. A244]PTH86334.1 hypothetical protein C9J60_24715 [Streptomyces sp. A244]